MLRPKSQLSRSAGGNVKELGIALVANVRDGRSFTFVIAHPGAIEARSNRADEGVDAKITSRTTANNGGIQYTPSKRIQIEECWRHR